MSSLDYTENLLGLKDIIVTNVKEIDNVKHILGEINIITHKKTEALLSTLQTCLPREAFILKSLSKNYPKAIDAGLGRLSQHRLYKSYSKKKWYIPGRGHKDVWFCFL